MDFVKQHMTLYLVETGLLFIIFISCIILQILISKNQIFKPYRMVATMANMMGCVIGSIWISATSLTFFEEIVLLEGLLPFYINRILPFVLGAWVVYFSGIVVTHFLTVSIQEHKIYKRTEQMKELDKYKSEFFKK